MTWYWLAWKLCLTFDGRASRKAFWMFFLINLCVGGILLFCEFIFKIHWAFDVIYSCVNLLPTLAITIRRLHDTGRSGWWTLLLFLPGIGVLVLLIMLAQSGSKEANIYDLQVSEGIAK
ncbi:DUF805 domain-containing protein [Kiloniella antarctica]|uniref:DUF805 domain-containing protein n=1 Tax=Kiloniella antarctica TaxID=1550907 RepID=A0ABW5BHA8_9PROT